MKPLKLVAIFALIVAMLVGGFSVVVAAATAPLQLPDLPATLTVETPGVEVKRDGSSDWIAIETQTDVEPGDAIRTDATGRADINFFDQGVVRLDVSTEITLSQAMWDAQSPDTFVGSVFLETGRLWSRFFDFVSPDSAFEVETGSTVATVRGTIFSVTAKSNGDAWVYVDEHAVNVRAKTNVQNIQQTAEAGEHVSVEGVAEFREGKTGAPTLRLEREASEDFRAWIERNRERDRAFERTIRDRMRTFIRNNGFTALAERVRLAVALRGDTREELSQRFQIRRALVERLELRDALPEIRVRDESADALAPEITTSIDTTVSLEINGQPIETWTVPITTDPAPVEPALEPVTEPIIEPVLEPVIDPAPVETAPYPVSMTISAGAYALDPGEQTILRAYLTYSDDSWTDVSKDVNWDIYADPQTGMTIGNTVSNLFIAGDQGGSAIIEATYYDGDRRVRSNQMTIRVSYPTSDTQMLY